MNRYIRRGETIFNCAKIISVTKHKPIFSKWRLKVKYANDQQGGIYFGAPFFGVIVLRREPVTYTFRYDDENDCDGDLVIFERIVKKNRATQYNPLLE